jgi:vitamin B12 transporter
MKNRNLRAPLAALPLAILATISHAQTQTLPETVVTATRIATRADALTSEVVVVDREAIERSAGRTLPEVLARTASVQVTSNGGRGKASSIFIRGTEARHTILLIDGVRYGSATLGTPAWDNIPVDMIERIEVLKGPASALYGADAVGGVVQIFTRRGAPGLQPYASLTLGSDSFRELSAGVRGGQDSVSYSLGISDVTDKGFSATNSGVPFGNYNADRDGFSQQSVSASLDWKLARDWKLTTGLLYSDGITSFDDGPGTVDTRTAVRTSVARAGLEGRIASNWVTSLMFNNSVDRGNALAAVKSFNFPSLFQTTQDQWVWQNDVSTPLGAVVAGIDSLQQKVDSTTAYTVSQRRINGVFAGLNGAAGAHSWQLNVRRDNNSQFGSSTTGFAGYGYQLSSQWRAQGGYGTSFAAPTFNRLYFPGFSNPLLQPEEGKNLELGLDWTRGNHNVKLLRFDNKILGFITSGTSPVNLPRARIDGWTLGYAGSFDALTLRASADALDPRNELNGRQLPRRAKSQATLGADYRVGALTFGGAVLSVGKRFDDAANTTPLAGYTTLDLHADYALARDWTLQANLNNTTNRAYETARGYNQPGRQVFVTLRYTPK